MHSFKSYWHNKRKKEYMCTKQGMCECHGCERTNMAAKCKIYMKTVNHHGHCKKQIWCQARNA